jgi:hypothetical protein
MGKGALERVHHAFADQETKAMSACETVPLKRDATIEVIEVAGDWYVRICENGTETVATFNRKSLALYYAELRRGRLGLEKVDIL